MKQGHLAKIPIITGPTGVGKTAVAIEAAKMIQGEVISADSMQIYRYMNIGTAKPDSDERQEIPHHMVDIIDPNQRFTAADFQHRAYRVMEEIIQQKKTPVVVGGTGLYIHSLVFKMDFTDISIDEGLRDQLEEEAMRDGNEALHRKLASIDPKAADRIHPNNRKRVIRAIEVRTNGKDGIQDFSSELEKNDAYDFRIFVLNEDREVLYQRINKRVDLMLESGLIQEVKWLLEQGFDPAAPALQGVGYKESIRYLNGEIGYEEAVEIIKRNTRRYAKRQITWFKKLPQAEWIHLNDNQPREKTIQQVAKHVADQMSRDV